MSSVASFVLWLLLNVPMVFHKKSSQNGFCVLLAEILMCYKDRLSVRSRRKD